MGCSAIDRTGPGRGRRAAARLLLPVSCAWLLAGEARADEVTIPAPRGWSDGDADDEAQRRAAGWVAERADARLGTVLTPDSRDDFAEVLATIEIDGTYDAHATAEAELERAIDRMLPHAPERVQVTSVAAEGTTPPQVRARWTEASIAYRVALVPSGNTRTLLVLATLDSEAPLYERTFDATLAGLRGAAAPRIPFDHARWRMLALLAWLVPAALVLGLATVRKPAGLAMVWIGRGCALLFCVAALVAGVLVHERMLARAAELQLAGISPTTITAETVSYGLGTALLCWLVGSLLARRERPVVSAPSSGVFAGRSSASMSVQIPAIIKIDKAAQHVRRHPDGPSRLDPVTDPPGGSLRAIDPGVEPRDVD